MIAKVTHLWYRLPSYYVFIISCHNTLPTSTSRFNFPVIATAIHQSNDNSENVSQEYEFFFFHALYSSQTNAVAVCVGRFVLARYLQRDRATAKVSTS